MSRWVAGCGIVTLIVVAALGAVIYYVYRQGQEIDAAMREVHAAYTRLNREHPFEPPADGTVDPERYARFLETRRPVAEKVRTELAAIREGGIVGKVKGVFHLLRDLGSIHVEALRAAGMSFDEYNFLARELITVLKAEASKPSPDPGIREIYDAMLRFQTRLGELNVRSGGGSANELDLGLTTVNPVHIKVPEGNVRAVAENKAAALESVEAYLLDLFVPALRHEMQRKDPGAAPPGGAPEKAPEGEPGK